MNSKTFRNILVTSGALLLVGLLIILFSCKSVSSVTGTSSSEKIEIAYKDSIRYFDSTVIVPVERYVDIVRSYDTLELETSQAKARAWVDSIFLRGEIKNKAIVQYKYTEKSQVKDSLVGNDKEHSEISQIETIRYIKNPVNKNLLIWAIISTLGFIVTLWFTFKKKIIKYIT